MLRGQVHKLATALFLLSWSISASNLPNDQAPRQKISPVLCYATAQPKRRFCDLESQRQASAIFPCVRLLASGRLVSKDSVRTALLRESVWVNPKNHVRSELRLALRVN